MARKSRVSVEGRSAYHLTAFLILPRSPNFIGPTEVTLARIRRRECWDSGNDAEVVKAESNFGEKRRPHAPGTVDSDVADTGNFAQKQDAQVEGAKTVRALVDASGESRRKQVILTDDGCKRDTACLLP